MKIIIKLSIILVCLLSISCVKNIDSFNEKELTYLKLPKEVQDTLFYYANLKIDSTISAEETNKLVELQGIDLIDFTKTYKIVHKELGPWISHIELIDNKNSKIKIDQGTAYPIIVYKEFIYIPEEYNIFHSDDMSKIKFKEYQIK